MKKKEQDKLSYKITKIQTLKFDFKEVENNVIDSLFFEEKPVKIKINITLNIDKKKSEITIDVNTFLPETPESNYVTHSGRTSFKVIELENFYDEANDIYQLPDNILMQFFSLSYSHCRALLAVELSNTNFKDKYFLPVVDPAVVFKVMIDNMKTITKKSSPTK